MINGVIIKELKKYEDDRGYLIEVYRRDEVDFFQVPLLLFLLGQQKLGNITVARFLAQRVHLVKHFFQPRFRSFLGGAMMSVLRGATQIVNSVQSPFLQIRSACAILLK